MGQLGVIDLTSICRNFPRPLSHEIQRDNLLATIDKIFEGDTHLIVLEGEEGIGKTTLLAQYAKLHPYNTISLFIRATSHLACTPEYIRVILCEQMNEVLAKETLDPERVDETLLRSQLTQLQSHASKKRMTFHFIVDGLEEIGETSSAIQETILKEMLPLGLTGFRFLVAGDIRKVSDVVGRSVQTKPFVVPIFSFDETLKYLKDLNLERHYVQDLHNMCRGIPAHLEIVRREMQRGVDAKSLLQEEA
ncbi:MAG: NACHT domain-containing protein, partial [candidate division Zixibacteria bacterium]|nr:NACHT domain-containing protein [candidate division Zixibacteria bacterium]